MVERKGKRRENPSTPRNREERDEREDDPRMLFQFLRQKLGLRFVFESLNEIKAGLAVANDRLVNILQAVQLSKGTLMASIAAILEAQTSGAVLITEALESIAAEVLEVQAAIAAAASGSATPEQLAEVLAKTQAMNAGLGQIKQSVAAIIPNIPTPDPAPPVEPTPKVPLPPVDAVVPIPVDPTNVTIETTPSDVALEGVPAIDFVLP